MAILKRVWLYPNTIYDCCQVICVILFSLGCSGFIKERDRFIYNSRTLLLSWLAVCWFACSLIACVYIKLQDPNVESLDNLIMSIIYMEIGMSTFMYLTTTGCMLLNVKRHLELYARIQDLDEILRKNFHCNLNYQRLLRKQVLILSFVILVYMTMILAAVSQASDSKGYFVHLLGGLAYTAVTGGPHLNCYAQMIMAELLSTRFRLLQKLLTKQIVCSPKLRFYQQVDCLRQLIYLVQEYHNCIRQINQVYAMCLASTLLHDFTLTTSELYLNLGSQNTYRENPLIWYIAVCMILPLNKMTLAPVYCGRTICEVDKCFKIIINSECWFPRNSDVHQMIYSCMLWRLGNESNFTCGTMILNKKVVASVYSEMFNYLLILIQFRMTQEMGDQIEKQKITIQEWIGVDYLGNYTRNYSSAH